MTTFNLYLKHKKGEVSREKFLYEVRRDNNLPWITNLTSYDDAVTILKHKGIVTDETPAVVGIPAIGLMAEGQTKEAKADEAVKAEVKAKAPSTKKPESLHIDQANPYEYRHGIAYELDVLGEYTDEALEKAKDKVLKNLAKDANFYSTLLNQKPSSYEFKASETDAPGMQAKADGHLKKELKKDEKSNVQDTLGKKEAGKKKPKGVKVMPDKGVTGSEKTIKEGIEDKVEDAIKSGKLKPEEVKAAAEKAMKGDSTDLISLMTGIKLSEDNVEEAKAKKYVVFDKARGENASKFFDTKEEAEAELKKINAEDPHHGDYVIDIEEGSFMGGVDLSEPVMKDEDEFEMLMKKYDWYAEFSDDPSKWSAQQSMEGTLRQLAKKIGVDKAVEIYNRYAPSDRKITSTHFMSESKHTKIKEALKSALKKEAIFKKANTSGGKEDLVVASSPKSRAELTKKGYIVVPGTEDATGLK